MGRSYVLPKIQLRASSVVRIRILSDLHLEFSDWRAPPGDEDLVVLAGDIGEGRSGIPWARRNFEDKDIIYVPGNHEYYGRDFDELRQGLRDSARTLGVHLLDGDELVLNGVRFLGATLWTDFALYGEGRATLEQAMRDSAARMTDDHVIRRWGGTLRLEDTREVHLAQRDWLQRALAGLTTVAQRFAGPTVIVTHHAPSPTSIAPRFHGSILNASFASDLRELMGPVVKLWVHGHMHNSLDYVERGTRVVCNPGGYVPFALNPQFDPGLVIEV